MAKPRDDEGRKVSVNLQIDKQQLEVAERKAQRLSDMLKEARTLADELASMEIEFTAR